jgi:3-dehydroquinate synthase
MTIPVAPGVYPDAGGFGMRATDGTGYRIDIATGVLDPAHPLLASHLVGRRVQVFAGPTVLSHYGDPLRRYLAANLEPDSWQLHLIDTGEANKTLASVEWICGLAKAGGLDRRGVMVSVGGGVITDLVGFAASMFARGVDHVKVNTTLVGQVDVGVGVKTGVNALGSKNMLGTYYPAVASINDPGFLRTLPIREIRCGLGEIVKMAVIADPDLFASLERHPHVFAAAQPGDHERQDRVARRAIELMLQGLHTNLREHDLARLVDFGHTFSPVIEMASGHRVAHGEAVAMDIALSTRLAVLLGRLSATDGARIIRLLMRLGLPTTDPATCTPQRMTAALAAARERRGGRLNLVVPTGIGTAAFVDDVPDRLLSAALADLVELAVAAVPHHEGIHA